MPCQILFGRPHVARVDIYGIVQCRVRFYSAYLIVTCVVIYRIVQCRVRFFSAYLIVARVDIYGMCSAA